MVVHVVHMIDNRKGRNTQTVEIEHLRLIRSNADGLVKTKATWLRTDEERL